MAAAYGLYTHIQSNKRRSIALLLGLFFLVYVMVFAGALLAEALTHDASLDWLLRAAWRDLIWASPFATVGTAPVDRDRLFLQPVADRCRHRRARGHAQGGAAALQPAGEPLHLARHHHAEAEGDGERRAQRLRQRAERAAIFHHGDDRAARASRRSRGRGGARPRADPHPQRRRPHAGDRRDHRGRDRLLRRTDLPHDVPGRACAGGGGRSSSDGDRGKGGGGDRHRHRARPDRGGLAALDRDPLRAVAAARISGRRRLGGADQESRTP